MARYGHDWLSWEWETLAWAIRRDFGPIGEITANKIHALRTAATGRPWEDWDVFENCGLAWNDVIPIFGAIQPMEPSQIAFTTRILSELGNVPLETEVVAYEAAILDERGFVVAPEEWFPGAQALLDRKTWLGDFRAEVQRAWEALRDGDPEAIAWRADHPVDLHVAKLFVVQVYLRERDALRHGDGGPERLSRPIAATSPPVPR
jgi:hypothetical protein